MPGMIVDGNRFADVADASHLATERARRGEGPSLIECKTYRIRGHSRSDRNRYRTKEEIEAWMKQDPIALLEAELEGFGLVSRAEMEAIAASVEREVADAIEFARTSPAPSPDEVTRYVYTDA